MTNQAETSEREAIVSECCRVALSADDRYCSKCGHEARAFRLTPPPASETRPDCPACGDRGWFDLEEPLGRVPCALCKGTPPATGEHVDGAQGKCGACQGSGSNGRYAVKCVLCQGSGVAPSEPCPHDSLTGRRGGPVFCDDCGKKVIDVVGQYVTAPSEPEYSEGQCKTCGHRRQLSDGECYVCVRSAPSEQSFKDERVKHIMKDLGIPRHVAADIVVPSEPAAIQEAAEHEAGKSEYFKAAQDISRYRFDPAFSLVEDIVKLAETAYAQGLADGLAQGVRNLQMANEAYLQVAAASTPGLCKTCKGSGEHLVPHGNEDCRDCDGTGKSAAWQAGYRVASTLGHDLKPLTDLAEKWEAIAKEFQAQGDELQRRFADILWHRAGELRAVIATLRPLDSRQREIDIHRAVEILNEHWYMQDKWMISDDNPHNVEGTGEFWMPAFAAIAIAEKYLRDSPNGGDDER